MDSMRIFCSTLYVILAVYITTAGQPRTYSIEILLRSLEASDVGLVL
jgi:hypothetical protein